MAEEKDNGGFFRYDELPHEKGCRWFVKRDDFIYVERGFFSKEEASDWIKNLGHRVDWRVGFMFKLRGDSLTMQIVSRNGTPAKV